MRGDRRAGDLDATGEQRLFEGRRGELGGVVNGQIGAKPLRGHGAPRAYQQAARHALQTRVGRFACGGQGHVVFQGVEVHIGIPRGADATGSGWIRIHIELNGVLVEGKGGCGRAIVPLQVVPCP